MEKYLDNKIKELEELLYRDSLSTYGSGLLDAYKDLKKQLALCNVVGRSEQLLCKHCNNKKAIHSETTGLCPDRFKHFEAK